MIGLGTASIGRPKYINIKTKLSEEPFNKTRFIQKGKSMLTEAYKQGIRHFDTAPGYGIAESILLEWISEYQPKAITISTKWGYTYVANFEPNAKVHEIKEHSLSKLNAQWEVSKQLLPYLNMYQIHSATLDSGVLENKEVLGKLSQLKKEHNLKIGLSTSGDNQNEIIQKALAIKIDNKALFDSFQVTFNVFEQNLLKISHLLKQENKTIIIKEALANGRIFPNSNFSQYKNTYNALKAISKKYGTSIDSVALRFCLDSVKPYSVLSGVTEKDHLTSNLLTRNFNLTENEINQIKNLAINPYYYWNERKQMPWV